MQSIISFCKFREADLLFDYQRSSEVAKQRVAVIIAHELAHVSNGKCYYSFIIHFIYSCRQFFIAMVWQFGHDGLVERHLVNIIRLIF